MEPSEGVRPGGGPGRVPGFEVGHWDHPEAATGCTVILARAGARAGASVLGGAAGTRELEPLRPGHVVESIHGLCLTGGSAFGLDAAGGVMGWLEERSIGFPTSGGVVPIVPSAVIYDLAIAGRGNRPGPEAGRKAAAAAEPGPVAEGSRGVGRGATVGKLLGHERAMKGGLGASRLEGGPVPMGALAVVNAFGDVHDPASGEQIAGPRRDDGSLVDTLDELASSPDALPSFRAESTTLAAVAIGADLGPLALERVAIMAQQGIARTIRPVHTRVDGDVCFALAAPPGDGDADDPPEASIVGGLAAELVALACVRAVQTAAGRAGVPGLADDREG